MKKLSLLLLSVVLVGGGCLSSAPDSQDTVPESDVVESSAVPAPGFNEIDEMVVNENDGGAAEATEELDLTDLVAFDMKTGNFFFGPDTLTVKAGQQVAITFTENEGLHTFVIDEIDFKRTIQKGGTVVFTAPTEPGNYPYYCDIGRHRELGMEGVLIVE